MRVWSPNFEVTQKHFLCFLVFGIGNIDSSHAQMFPAIAHPRPQDSSLLGILQEETRRQENTMRYTDNSDRSKKDDAKRFGIETRAEKTSGALQ